MYQTVCCALLLVLMLPMGQAAKPLWTFTPAAGFNPTMTVPDCGMTNMQYVIQNQSTRAKRLVMIPIPGITQSAPCLMAPKGQAAPVS